MTQDLTPRQKLAQAAIDVVRAKGYAATRVEDICAAAGVTKGSFFHHFTSKDEAAAAAAEHWNCHAHGFFGAAPFWANSDPVTRLLGYVDFRIAILTGPVVESTCFAGAMIQEIHQTHPALREACAVAIDEHIALVEGLVEAAKDATGLSPDWSARSLSAYIHAVVQGSLILAKAHHDHAPAIESLQHLRRHLEQVFARS